MATRKPRTSQGVFKPTAKDKAIMEKRPVNPPKLTQKPRPRAGVFKLTPEEKAILTKRPISKPTAPKSRISQKPRTSR